MYMCFHIDLKTFAGAQLGGYTPNVGLISGEYSPGLSLLSSGAYT